MDALGSLLSEDENERSCRFAFPYLKRNFVISRARLRLILSEYLKQSARDIKFCYGKYGKPMLIENEEIKFNLAHSGDQVVYAISHRNEVGIDIEQIRGDVYSIGMEHLCLSSKERNVLENLSFSSRMQAFYSLWTYKEAVLKGLGCGLIYPLPELDIDIESDINPKIRSKQLSEWKLYTLSCPSNFKGAVAVKGKGSRLFYKEWKE